MSKHSAINRFGRSGNPAFQNHFSSSTQDQVKTDAASSNFKTDIAGAARSATILSESQHMSLNGTVNKTGMLLGLCAVGAFIGWTNPSPVLILSSVVIGFILAIVTVIKPQNAQYTATLYAAVEGVALGGITFFAESQFPGIGIQAVGLTFGILASLLFFYKSGIIKPTENFRLMIFSATAGIALLYLISFIMSFFGTGIGFIHSNGLFGIGFSIFVVGIAALNLVLDFDFIEEGSEVGLPKFMEWYGAFALMVTLVWLYMEILRLLMKLRSR